MQSLEDTAQYGELIFILSSTNKCTRHIRSSLNIHRKWKEWQKDSSYHTLNDYTWRAFTEANIWKRWGMQSPKLPSTFPEMLPGWPLHVISSASSFPNTGAKRSVPWAWNSWPVKPPGHAASPLVALRPILSHSSPTGTCFQTSLPAVLVTCPTPIQHLFSPFSKGCKESRHPSHQLLSLAWVVLQCRRMRALQGGQFYVNLQASIFTLREWMDTLRSLFYSLPPQDIA